MNRPLRRPSRGGFARFAKDDEEPLWAELFSPERLEQHARSLAAAQSVGERTTSSVVQTISLVILLDALAALFYMEMDW